MEPVYKKKVEPFLDKIGMMALCGKGENEIAQCLGISLATLRKYRKEHEALDRALKEKERSTATVMRAFFKRACGYTAEEETCERKGKANADGVVEDEQIVRKTVRKDVPPDIGAIKWWLENAASNASAPEEMDIGEARELLREKQRLLAEDREKDS